MNDPRVEAAANALYLKYDTEWNHAIVRWNGKDDDSSVSPHEKQKWRAMAWTALRAADKVGQR